MRSYVTFYVIISLLILSNGLLLVRFIQLKGNSQSLALIASNHGRKIKETEALVSAFHKNLFYTTAIWNCKTWRDGTIDSLLAKYGDVNIVRVYKGKCRICISQVIKILRKKNLTPMVIIADFETKEEFVGDYGDVTTPLVLMKKFVFDSLVKKEESFFVKLSSTHGVDFVYLINWTTMENAEIFLKLIN